ncbi:MAG: hypothetical protein K8U57_23130 [Planctomycetes bacterium]|nr:hypothetical protein [Planctomycetota bacterium]
MNSVYPERPRFFAHKFCRLMGKVCLGGDIGPDACWLLAFIVNTEDAAGYRRAVTFFNDDLATRTGLSLAGMKRLRDKAVEAGWLNYEPGAKGRAARYFVTVPAWADGLDDVPGDERAGSLSGGIVAQGEPESHRQADGIRTECEPHSSLSLSLTKYPPAVAVEVVKEQTPETKPKPDPKPKRSAPDACPMFAKFWEAYPNRVDKPAAMKAWGKLNVDDTMLADILAGLERYKAAKQEWQAWKHPGPWLNARRWEDEPPRTVGPPGEATRIKRASDNPMLNPEYLSQLAGAGCGRN